MVSRVDVLGVGITAASLSDVLAEVERWVVDDETHYICVTGVHGVMESQRDPDLLRIHNESGLTVADGMPMLWAGRAAGARTMERIRGSDLMLALCERARDRGWRNYFYGGAAETPGLLAQRLGERFAGLGIAGTYSPPFRPLTVEENDAIVERINGSGAQLLWVGLSTPKQERWIAANIGRLRVAAVIGVGMAFDVHAGLVGEAPIVIQNSGLEWLYRLLREPRRLWRRYLRNNPVFLLQIVRRRPFLRGVPDAPSLAPRPARSPDPSAVETPISSRLKRLLFSCFRAGERARVHLLPSHFYSPVADRRWLAANPELWRLPLPGGGVIGELEPQLRWLEATCAAHLAEVRGFSFLGPLAERGIDFRYGLIEAQVLHCVVRALAPRLIVEVGSGASTAISSDALVLNARDARLVAIDPYAPAELDFLEHVEVMRVPVQTVPLEVFAELSAGDLLFIDSTHVLKTGSELPRLYLDVLPSLAAGVTIHIHDIFLPWGYSPWVMSDFWDWQETVLVTALITGNGQFEVLCCESALHEAMPEHLREILPDYVPRELDAGLDPGTGVGHVPSSIWLRSS